MNTSAIICPIKNEKVYIKLFLDYYSRHFEAKDIYILDFGSDPEYLKEYIGDRATVINTSANILDAYATFVEIRKTMQSLKKEHNYTYVLPLDVDEIIYYDDPNVSLKKYLETLKKDFVTCKGYEVVHIPGIQPDFDYEKPWFSQLEYWYSDSQHYNKTLISRHDLDWRIGFHLFYINGKAVDRNEYIDEKLFLVHLHKHDFNYTIDKHLKAASLEWSKNTIKEGYNRHYRNKNIEKVKEWYFESILKKQVYKIPEHLKKNIDL